MLGREDNEIVMQAVHRGFRVRIGTCGPTFVYKVNELGKMLRDLKQYLSGSTEYVQKLIEDSSAHIRSISGMINVLQGDPSPEQDQPYEGNMAESFPRGPERESK